MSNTPTSCETCTQPKDTDCVKCPVWIEEMRKRREQGKDPLKGPWGFRYRNMPPRKRKAEELNPGIASLELREKYYELGFAQAELKFTRRGPAKQHVLQELETAKREIAELEAKGITLSDEEKEDAISEGVTECNRGENDFWSHSRKGASKTAVKVTKKLLDKGEIKLAREVLALDFDFTTENRPEADNDSARKLEALREEMLESLRKVKSVLQGVYDQEARLKAAKWVAQLEGIIGKRGAMATTASDLYQQLR